jgi:hypothetical protein
MNLNDICRESLTPYDLWDLSKSSVAKGERLGVRGKGRGKRD